MRFGKLLLPFTRLVSSLSVRARIVVLALVPVVGFLANGLTYMSSEGEVGGAFQTVNRSATLAAASRDFKNTVGSMRIAVKDFAASPSVSQVVAFNQAQKLSLQSLDTIENTIGIRHRDNITALRKEVTDLKQNFEELLRAQRILGFDEDDGLRRDLRVAGNAVEALSMAKDFLPNALVLDVGLPDHSGLWVLDQLKRDLLSSRMRTTN